jgi:Flp pilus assembly protein TadB
LANLPDSLEDKLRAVAAEIAGYEVEANKLRMFQSQAFQMHQSWPIEKQVELEEWHRRIAEAQQKQVAILLGSIGDSSNRLEVATRNLQHSSESQVKVAEAQVKVSESQVKVSESQVKTTKRLLKSSMNLETFTLYLIVVAMANIVVVIAQASGTKWSSIQLGVMAVVVFVGLAAALIYSRFQEREAKKLDKTEP